MTGSHEVRGSIPLGSTNPIKHLQRQRRLPSVPFVVIAYLEHRYKLLAKSPIATKTLVYSKRNLSNLVTF